MHYHLQQDMIHPSKRDIEIEIIGCPSPAIGLRTQYVDPSSHGWLLVVMTIIGMLIAILLSVMAKEKRAARLFYGMSNQQKLGIGVSTDYATTDKDPAGDIGSAGVIYKKAGVNRIVLGIKVLRWCTSQANIPKCCGVCSWRASLPDFNHSTHPDADRNGRSSACRMAQMNSKPWVLYVCIAVIPEIEQLRLFNPLWIYRMLNNPPVPNNDCAPKQISKLIRLLWPMATLNGRATGVQNSPFEACYTNHNGIEMRFVDGNRLYVDGRAIVTSSRRCYVYRRSPQTY